MYPMKIFLTILKPYMSVVHVRIIDRLIADNNRLNQKWSERYSALEREMRYWKELYQDEFLSGKDES